ncbi:DUF2812 domain-containing protein [Streptomyces sp. A3M-1-3]|uniref:DUF2812 domain-containing protein n=1 Tax=Streptomyces sp. A3M-1-3 TaxID=2962044 RepID=UPI0020B84452|nr:DUF2812 domain-containing protein [Streptomyces sp. A3M-1-3]MCP3816786.1 DUF2812 domain-containing protein [Streptomyces sp. A3M-1-3]
MTETTDYFDALAAALRKGGMEGLDVAATVAELNGYLAETGAAAQEEFGPVEEFAARLAGGASPAEEPTAEAETWKWAADIYVDRKHLNAYGDEGWEVERIDRLGRFVSRREPGAAMRWEYRREVTRIHDRSAVAADLAPEGWEVCGQWLYFQYFKRPKAASAGPAAAIDAPPEAPGRWLFLSRGYRKQLWGALAAMLVSGTVTACAVRWGANVTAILIGAAVAAPIGGLLGWYRVKRDILTGAEEYRGGRSG